MATPIKTRILLRNDTLANWGTSNLVLGKGEMAIATLDGNFVEVRVGDGTHTWADSYKLKVDASQISGLVETIQGTAKKYQVVANGGNGNSWKLQEAALSGGEWTDVTGSTWTVDFSAYYTAEQVNAISTALSNDYVEKIANVNNSLSDYAKLSAASAMSAYALEQAEDYADAICTDISTTVAADYLTKSAFNDLSNEIGLSAANSGNPVVTKNDIADLAGAMHFRGAVTPTEGQTDVAAIEDYYTAQGLTKAAGDVVIITTNSKEYVYNGTAWIELGDEVLYATKAEVNTISTQLTGDIAGITADVDYLSGVIDDTRTTLNTVSSDYLTSADKEELTALVGTVSVETLLSANAYTDEKFSGLSDYYTKDEVNSISTALSTDYVGKIATAKSEVIGESTDLSTDNTVYGAKKYADGVAAAAESSAKNYADGLAETVSAETLVSAYAYTDKQIAALSIGDYALSADVDALVGAVSAETRLSANAYTDEQISALSIDNYIKHREVVDTDLSGFFILNCGGAALREGEPTAPLS